MKTSKTLHQSYEPSAISSRLIGHLKGSGPGPTIIFTAGMHGNEPSGVYALQRFFAAFAERQEQVKGEVIAITGNLKALQQGVRYLDRDLNRMWYWDPFRKTLPEHDPAVAETEEFHDITRILQAAIESRRGAMIFVDLHTTSVRSIPFVLLGDTLRNRDFALRIPVPKILGLEEQLRGPLLSYINELGHISMAFEAGQHDDPGSVDRHESFIWLCLEQAGILPGRHSLTELVGYHRKRLAGEAAGLKGFYELRYRFGLEEEDVFRMEPGFVNFQRIDRYQPLAHHNGEQITAKERGRIFMPLYQDQGDDGFFVVRSIAPFWLWLSRRMRYWKVSGLLPLLPGISRHPLLPDTLILNTRIARWYGLQLFHLLGYRKRWEDGPNLLLAKRPFDTAAP